MSAEIPMSMPSDNSKGTSDGFSGGLGRRERFFEKKPGLFLFSLKKLIFFNRADGQGRRNNRRTFMSDGCSAGTSVGTSLKEACLGSSPHPLSSLNSSLEIAPCARPSPPGRRRSSAACPRASAGDWPLLPPLHPLGMAP